MPPETGPHLSVVIPAYNEAANVRSDRLSRLDHSLSVLGFESEVIVVDDGSEDATVGLLEEFAEKHDRFSIVRNDHRGKAEAVSAGVLQARGDFVLFMDMDMATSLEHVGPFVQALQVGEADIVIASRDLPGSERLNTPPTRRFLAKAFNILVSTLLLPGVRDSQCGFKAFRRQVARDLFGHFVVFSSRPGTVKGPRVTAFDVELLVLARRYGYRLKQMPVIWTHATTGGVRVFRESFKMLREVLTIWLYDRRGRYNPNGRAPGTPPPVTNETEG